MCEPVLIKAFDMNKNFKDIIKRSLFSFLAIIGFTLFSVSSFSFDTIDDVFLEVSKEESRFAGVFKDQGQLVILTTDGNPLLEKGSLEYLDITDEEFNGASFKIAARSFQQLYDVHQILITILNEIPIEYLKY